MIVGVSVRAWLVGPAHHPEHLGYRHIGDIGDVRNVSRSRSALRDEELEWVFESFLPQRVRGRVEEMEDMQREDDGEPMLNRKDFGDG